MAVHLEMVMASKSHSTTTRSSGMRHDKEPSITSGEYPGHGYSGS
ncbi:hypothetical protein HMPREF9565_01497 [Cutibacterium acnes HL053PA2]|nr:hypothetical protein HMPREF9618_01712 [Cutibacterium acnes HL082PA1]EFT50243.1 hypothetical protein HMPREF9565_01497 [Cutibacterium acnes HL053PA2]